MMQKKILFDNNELSPADLFFSIWRKFQIRSTLKEVWKILKIEDISQPFLILFRDLGNIKTFYGSVR